MKGAYQVILRLAMGGCLVFAPTTNAAEAVPGDAGSARTLASKATCPPSDPNWPHCINYKMKWVVFFDAILRGQVGLTGTDLVPSTELPPRADAPDGTTNDRGGERRPREDGRKSTSPSPAPAQPQKPSPGSRAPAPAS